jgi:hypothetical protein
MRTGWGHIGNKGKKQKFPVSPSLQKEKTWLSMRACWAFPFVAWKFSFQNCWSPFFAWSNTPIMNWGYLLAAFHWEVACSPIFPLGGNSQGESVGKVQKYRSCTWELKHAKFKSVVFFPLTPVKKIPNHIYQIHVPFFHIYKIILYIYIYIYIYI